MLIDGVRLSKQYKTGRRRIVENTENVFGLRREPSCVEPCKCRD